MMNFKDSNGNTFTAPEHLQDVTLQQFIDFVTGVEPTKPDLLKQIDETVQLANDDMATTKEKRELSVKLDELIEQASDPLHMAKHVHPYYARVVSYWTGMNEKYILGKDGGEGMNLASLKGMHGHLMDLVNRLPEVEYSNVIEKDGELWYLPERFMQDSTVIEFAEAAQFQANLAKVLGGDWISMAKVMCVLVRKKGELYSDKLLKREQDFLNWDMLNVWKVAFFLLKRSETYKPAMQAYINAQQLAKLQQVLKD
jgi:hypothetical protein